jgi:4-hydroxybenzoate polyprenyltransferase
MDWKTKLVGYFRLMRFQSAASESLLILIGALLMGQHDPWPLLILFCIGVLFHIYGFVLNDYADIEVDKKSVDLKKKPLVSGLIPTQHALIIIIVAVVCIYILIIAFFYSVLSVLILSLALFLGGIYDYFGKKISHISDFFVAGALAFTVLFGASTVSSNITIIIYIISLLIFIGIVFANAVEGGLKDVDHDYLGGAKTIPTLLGVKVADGCLLMTKRFLAFAYGLIALCFLLLIFLFMQPAINFFDGDYLRLCIVGVLLVVILFVSYKFLSLSLFNRLKMKRLYAVINSLAGMVLLITLYPFIGLDYLIILLLIPITWYVVFNTLLYGKPLQPDV